MSPAPARKDRGPAAGTPFAASARSCETSARARTRALRKPAAKQDGPRATVKARFPNLGGPHLSKVREQPGTQRACVSVGCAVMGNAQSGSIGECCAGRKYEPAPAPPGTNSFNRSGNGVRLEPLPDAKITDLVGTWKVEAEEGSLDEYLSLIGVPWVFRKMVVRPIHKQPLQTWRMEGGTLVTGYEERGDEPDKWPLVRDEVWRNPITTQLTKRSIVFQNGVLSQTSHGWVDGHVAETRFFVVGVRFAPQGMQWSAPNWLARASTRPSLSYPPPPPAEAASCVSAPLLPLGGPSRGVGCSSAWGAHLRGAWQDQMVEQCYIDGRLMYGKRSYRVSL